MRLTSLQNSLASASAGVLRSPVTISLVRDHLVPRHLLIRLANESLLCDRGQRLSSQEELTEVTHRLSFFYNKFTREGVGAIH